MQKLFAWRESLVAMALVACAACSGARADLPDVTADEPTPRTLHVRRGSLESRVLLTGTLEATRGVRITPPRTPTWQVQIRWMEEDGANVTAGQKVVELDNTSYATDLEQKRLAARTQEKEIQQQKAQADARAVELRFAVDGRDVELSKARIDAGVPPELIPLREYQEKQLVLERARTALAKAEVELAAHILSSQQELAIRRAGLEQSLYEIRIAERAINELALEAPTDGVLIIGDVRREDRKLQVGDSVWPGYVVARIPDLSEMHVEAQLSDVDDGRVHAGWAALVRLDSYPDLSFPGVVRDITPIAQPTSTRSLRRAFRVRVALARTEPEIMRPGMAAQVEVRPPGVDDVLLAPRQALDVSSSPPMARLEDGDSVPVDLGPCNNVECVVVSGLDESAALRARGER